MNDIGVLFTSAGSIARRRLSSRVERLEKSHECSGLRGTQIFSVSGHVAAALDDLANELILGELYGHSIQLGSAQPSHAPERVAIVALLGLKNERPLPLQRRAPLQVLCWNRF